MPRLGHMNLYIRESAAYPNWPLGWLIESCSLYSMTPWLPFHIFGTHLALLVVTLGVHLGPFGICLGAFAMPFGFFGVPSTAQEHMSSFVDKWL